MDTLENEKSDFGFLYDTELPITEKLETICKEIYGAGRVVYGAGVMKKINSITELGFGNLPICVAKNQYSLSDDATRLGRPEGFDITISDVYVNAGAGFVVVLTGNIMTMPGLPKVPAAERVDVDDSGKIVGLF
jgi:formate--tetrahydrofolate ligase